MKPAFLFLISFFLVAAPASAQETGTCETGRADSYLDINNVRARILNNGALFWSGEPRVYEVPKGGGVHVGFGSNLWIGGLIEGELHLAGSTSGPYEFFPGPLTDTGTLPDPNDCSPYDRLYNVSLRDMLVYEQLGILTDDLRDWPWQHGAPVKDGDGNPYNYNLAGGDRPDFPGHQGLWWIMNDLGNAHTRTKGTPIGLEVQAMAFAGASRIDAINDATLYRYRLVNKSAKPIELSYIGFHVYPDLGGASDDYVGSDTTYGLAYVYNADNDDGGYGEAPPALGYKVLQGPLVDADGEDNDHDGRVDEPDERLDMTSFIDFHGGGGVRGDPNQAQDLYYYMQAKWRDGKHVTYGGDGRNFSDISANFMYPGDPVTDTFWSDGNSDNQGTANPPHDRRFVMGSGPFTIPVGGQQEIVVAILWARGEDHLDSITQLREASIIVQQAYDYGYDIAQLQGLAPVSRTAFLVPADGATGQPTNTQLIWAAIDEAETYLLQISRDPGFQDVLLTKMVPSPQHALDLQPHTQYYWRVAAVNLYGVGPFTEAETFSTSEVTLMPVGVLELEGQYMFVEVVGPGGSDPCGPEAVSTFGCDLVGGNHVYGSLNGDSTYIMTNLGGGSEAHIGEYAPNDFEIRFTEKGSYAYALFQSGAVIWVPFEVWDIGSTTPFTENDPSDDVQMIGRTYSTGGGECEWAYGESSGPPYNRPGTNGAADFIYAYYPTTTYADWEATVEPLVEADPSRCPASPVTDEASGLIDIGRGRPIQQVIFFDLTGDLSVTHPGFGTVVRFYTTDAHAPILSAPADQQVVLAHATTLWWQRPSGAAPVRVQVALDPSFSSLVVDRSGVAQTHLQVTGLAAGLVYYWRVIMNNLPSQVWSFHTATGTVFEAEAPLVFALKQNYPNPFNPSTTIRFTLPSTERVRLTVYDLLGREVARLVDAVLPAGMHEAVWNARSAASGLYVYRLEAGAHRAERKMLLVR